MAQYNSGDKSQDARRHEQQQETHPFEKPGKHHKEKDKNVHAQHPKKHK